MESIKAHIFDTIAAANEAIELINRGEGIPVNPEAITRTYTEPQENNDTIYIVADSLTEKYLGEPTDLELIYDDEI
jgi:hypothetical protein